MISQLVQYIYCSRDKYGVMSYPFVARDDAEARTLVTRSLKGLESYEQYEGTALYSVATWDILCGDDNPVVPAEPTVVIDDIADFMKEKGSVDDEV